jgi:hypothetical protein
MLLDGGATTTFRTRYIAFYQLNPIQILNIASPNLAELLPSCGGAAASGSALGSIIILLWLLLLDYQTVLVDLNQQNSGKN